MGEEMRRLVGEHPEHRGDADARADQDEGVPLEPGGSLVGGPEEQGPVVAQPVVEAAAVR